MATRYGPNLVGLPWIEAQNACTDDGAYLAVIDDAAEDTFVRGTIAAGNVWIGLSDLDVEGMFVRVTGHPLVYTNWGSGEPNGGTGESCAEIRGSGNWNDEECHEPRAYVCECAPAE